MTGAWIAMGLAILLGLAVLGWRVGELLKRRGEQTTTDPAADEREAREHCAPTNPHVEHVAPANNNGHVDVEVWQ